MKLKKLIKDIDGLTVKGSANPEITGLANNSKVVAFGNLFIAKKGISSDGNAFIEDAIAAGALAVLTDLYNPFLKKDIVQLIHKNPKEIEPLLAQNFYDRPDEKLFIVGITGTNGKTTTSYLIEYIFNELQAPCGLIGTVEWKVGNHSFTSTHTSPDILQNYKLFADMVEHKQKAASIEVSSHALDQGRLKGVGIDVAVFTNLTQDHLDYHKTMEHYAGAKTRLFSKEYISKTKKEAYAVVNADSPYCEQMIANTPRKVIRYGMGKSADLFVDDLVFSVSGFTGTLYYQNKSYPFCSKLCGKFNVYNVLAAIGASLAKGFKIEKILEVVKTFTTVPGRLEKISNPKDLQIFVDYAHTDDALANVLATLRAITKGKLITVFGCGGARDALKRPKMGKVASELSDIAIITSDNPRNEIPEKIAEDIQSGITQKEKVLVELDRALAIKKAVEIAGREDVVLIAGKGHERYQIFAHQTIAFDDREEALKATTLH